MITTSTPFPHAVRLIALGTDDSQWSHLGGAVPTWPEGWQPRARANALNDVAPHVAADIFLHSLSATPTADYNHDVFAVASKLMQRLGPRCFFLGSGMDVWPVSLTTPRPYITTAAMICGDWLERVGPEIIATTAERDYLAGTKGVLAFPAVRDFLLMTPQLSADVVQSLHDAATAYFPAARISYQIAYDPELNRHDLRMNVESEGLEDADLDRRERELFRSIETQPALIAALHNTIVSIW